MGVDAAAPYRRAADHTPVAQTAHAGREQVPALPHTELRKHHARNRNLHSRSADITMYGDGNSTKPVGETINSVSQLSEGLSQSLGIDLKALLNSVVAGHAAGKSMQDAE